MTNSDRKQSLLTDLKSHTVSSVRNNQKYKLPIVIKTRTNSVHNYYKDNIGYEIIDTNEYNEADITLTNNTITKTEDEDSYMLLQHANVGYYSKRCEVINVDQFHYNDTWYSYKYSYDNLEKTFGILRVENMPYNSFDGKRNMNSFICSAYELIANHYCEPFMIFINKQFVSLDDIEVVYDCGDTYLLLYGEKYNYYALQDASSVVNGEEYNNKSIYMVILPFAIDYIGKESDSHFNIMYEMFCSYIQNSLSTRENGTMFIDIPSINEFYEYKRMIYSVGSWYYKQLRYYELGILPTSRINKLKNIRVTKSEKLPIYNNNGDISDYYYNTLNTKFNALDRDSYDLSQFLDLTTRNFSFFDNNAIFKFNDDGLLSEDGEYIISLVDEDTKCFQYNSSEKYIYHIENNIDNIIFRENYLVFKDGLFDPDCIIRTSAYNTSRIDNENNNHYDIKIFYPSKLEKIISHYDHFNDQYIKNLANYCLQVIESLESGVQGYILNNDSNNIDIFITNNDSISQSTFSNIVNSIENLSGSDTNPIMLLTNNDITNAFINMNDQNRSEYFRLCLICLDYIYSDFITYDENVKNGLESLIEYDITRLNSILKTNIDSQTFTGIEANENINNTYAYESRKGLKIPRHKYENHESFIMIFEDGELLDEYSKMIVYPNFFFIPMDRLFNTSSQIEILWFNKVNNNEISFYLTDYIKSNMIEIDDNWRSTDIFNKYIDKKELKLFIKYPENYLIYKDIVKETDDIAFNISVPNNDDVYIMKDVIDSIDTSNIHEKYKLTAVSSRKFIYQRLYVDQNAYRIELDKRFRYCDNQKQYVLFINGRRMNDNTFLITIPKYSRPFWGIYLYTAKYVKPTDRIEIFYVPEELVDINTVSGRPYNLEESEHPCYLKENGYIEVENTLLKAPLDPKLYLFFINGRKIPATNIIPIDSHTVRINKDTYSLHNLMINPIYHDNLSEIENYMSDPDTWCQYDTLIRYIKSYDHLGYDEIDKLFNVFVTMSNTDDISKTNINVGKIAILNEIIRDFWVSSGYPYNDPDTDTHTFVYDYDTDDYIFRDDQGNIIIPALDANQDINIKKHEMHLASFSHTPPEDYYEIGSTINGMTFNWLYSDNIFEDGIVNNLQSQTMSYKHTLESDFTEVDIPINEREWNFPNDISSDIDFHFIADRKYQKIHKETNIRFVNGIYYGIIDEDELQNYSYYKTYEWVNELIGLIRSGNKVDTPKEISNIDDIPLEELRLRYKNVIKEIDYELMNPEEIEPSNLDSGIVNEDQYNITDYHSTYDLQHLLGLLNCNIQISPELILKNYIIGNNNYFIYACPKRLAFDKYGSKLIDFFMPNIHDEHIIRNCMISHNDLDSASPIYTSGKFEHYYGSNGDDHDLPEGLLEVVNQMDMIYIGDFRYTNPNGYTETYCVWKSNGFFTRLFNDYGVNISVRYKNTLIDHEDGLNHIIPALDTLSPEYKEYLKEKEAHEEAMANTGVNPFFIDDIGI